MNKFDEIIKQKAEQFEVPYNEAHWAEMDGRLDAIRTAKIRKNVFGSAAVVGIFALASYFAFNNNETPTKKSNTIITDNNKTEVVVDKNNPVENENLTPVNNTHKIINETINAEEQTIENNKAELEIEGKNKSTVVNYDGQHEEQKIASDNKAMLNNSPVNAEFITYNNNVCLGEKVIFESFENDAPVSYTWNFGDGTISHEANPKHIYSESYTYTVSLTLLNRQTGKEHTVIKEDAVTILPTPKTNFSYLEVATKYDNNKLKYPYTTFEVKETNKNYSYSWSFGNDETSTEKNSKTIYNTAGNYNVTLLVKNNSNGCSQSIQKKITIENGIDLFAQNGISPNSSIPENKVFIPGALLGWDVQFEMTIITKSGNTVYKTSDKNEPWNGRMDNSGELLNEGVYLWQVITYDAEGVQHRHHGKINLIK